MASAEMATGSSWWSRSRCPREIATSVFPTPVGPKMAMTRTPRSIVRRVSVHIATGLSTTPDARAGALEAASAAARGLDGRACDLAVMFASGAHLESPETTLVAVHEMLSPMTLVGCGAGGVISDAREVEDGTAISVWAASLGDGEVLPFHATVEEIEEGSGALSGLPDLEGAAGAILLADPFSFPTDAVLRFLSEATPLLPLLGGMASARSACGSTASRSSPASPRAPRRSGRS